MKMFLDRLIQNIHPSQDAISFSRLNMNDTFYILTSANRVNYINNSICLEIRKPRLSLTKSLKLSFRIFKAASPIRYHNLVESGQEEMGSPGWRDGNEVLINDPPTDSDEVAEHIKVCLPFWFEYRFGPLSHYPPPRARIGYHSPFSENFPNNSMFWCWLSQKRSVICWPFGDLLESIQE